MVLLNIKKIKIKELADQAAFSLRSPYAEAPIQIAPRHRVFDTPRMLLHFTGLAPGANHNSAPFGRLRLTGFI